MATATRHCDECTRWYAEMRECAKGHKPRFYQPTRIMDNNWGWKRKCEDFKELPNGSDRHS